MGEVVGVGNTRWMSESSSIFIERRRTLSLYVEHSPGNRGECRPTSGAGRAASTVVFFGLGLTLGRALVSQRLDRLALDARSAGQTAFAGEVEAGLRRRPVRASSTGTAGSRSEAVAVAVARVRGALGVSLGAVLRTRHSTRGSRRERKPNDRHDDRLQNPRYHFDLLAVVREPGVANLLLARASALRGGRLDTQLAAPFMHDQTDKRNGDGIPSDGQAPSPGSKPQRQ